MGDLGALFWFGITVFGSGLVLVNASGQHKWGVFLSLTGLGIIIASQRHELGQWVSALTGGDSMASAPQTPWYALLAFVSVAVGSVCVGVWIRARRGVADSKLGLLFEPRGPYVMDDFDPSVGNYRRVGVKNLTGSTLDGVEVFLDDFTPQGAEFLPIHLIMMHGVSQPFTLNPRQERHADVASYSAMTDPTQIILHYRAPNQIPVDRRPYTLTIRATARESAPCVRTFALDVDDAGRLVFTPSDQLSASAQTRFVRCWPLAAMLLLLALLAWALLPIARWFRPQPDGVGHLALSQKEALRGLASLPSVIPLAQQGEPCPSGCATIVSRDSTPCHEVTIAAEQIWTDRAAAKAPYAENLVMDKYKDNCVHWSFPMAGLALKGDTAEVHLAVGTFGDVAAKVKLQEYPELKVINRGEPVEMRGRIIGFVQRDVLALDQAILAFPQTCTDKIKDQDETDVDCGGTRCSPCVGNQTCNTHADCYTHACVNGRCTSCNGSKTNQCGGACPPCSDRQYCLVDKDCASGHCQAWTANCPAFPDVGYCVPATCFNGVADPTEAGVDCGGSCYPRGCPSGASCSSPCDCLAGHECVAKVCT